VTQNNLVALCTLCLLTICPHTARAQQTVHITPSHLPAIKKLSSKDLLYRQFDTDIENFYKHTAKRSFDKEQFIPPFYAYTADEKDTLLRIAASCSVTYDTIATVNAISSTDERIAGRTLILPAAKGIFVAKKPVSSIEILMHKKHLKILEENENIWYSINGREFCFLENEQFSSTERAFFLDASLKMPLDSYWLSSDYGMRISPISGKQKFHNGIDMAAPTGTSVYACKSGTAVLCKTGDPVYGNYIILQHTGGRTSVYAHLSRILIGQGDSVLQGDKIGEVGMTGAATGPHLHFEVRLNNVSEDPRKLLKK